ncbi:hypothetical protein AB0N62_45825 [Streptomyces sp. NPDC093982]|uniref:hypothetical protein n=1 Tax=Streptomyces sp. NPDC093982 TaxID=3155077 RepID=UPI003429BEA2
MTTLRTLKDGVTGVRCDTVGCPRSISVPHTPSALAAREFTTQHGWSTPAITASTMGDPRASDYCLSCTEKRALRAAICPRCVGGELFDLLGHTRVGHLAARALYQYDASLTGEEVARFSRAELLAMPAVGDQIADCVAAAVIKAYGITPSQGSSSSPSNLPSRPLTRYSNIAVPCPRRSRRCGSY